MKPRTSPLSLLAILLLFCTQSLVAQTHYEGNIFVGGKGGCTLSRVQFNPSVSQDFLAGALAGVTFRYIEEEHFGLQAELNFEQRGWKEKYKDHPDLKYSRTLSYLQLPVLAHIYFGSPRAHFFLNAGPEVGVLLSEKTSTNFEAAALAALPSSPLTGRQTAQLTQKATGHVDFGISAGLGMEYFLNSRNSLSLEGRFYYGLGNIIPSGRTDPFSASNSMSILISLGYSFRLK